MLKNNDGARPLQMSDRNYINAIERGLKILEVLGGAGRKLTLTEGLMR